VTDPAPGVASADRISRILRKPRHRVIGLMSGTSVDAIDAALVTLEGVGPRARVTLDAFRSFAFPAEIRRRLFQLFDPARGRVDEICNLDFLMGEVFAEAARRLMKDARIAPAEVDLIGSAGQTLWHDPEAIAFDAGVDWIERPIVTRSTFAIGQSAVIAERTGVVTVGDLRVRDVAAGGHGAPLIAYADWVLLRSDTAGRCVQNIGGIGNVTYLPPAAPLERVVAFDTGPGNMVIDALAEVISGGRERFDRDGKMAARGTVQPRLLSEWLEDPYFEKDPPKTTGREQFGVQFARRAMRAAQAGGISLEDLIATATELTAQTIADAYRRFLLRRGPIDEVIVGGGGSLNPYLMGRLAALLPGITLLRHEDVGIDSKAKEAIAIAVIARDSLAGLPTNVPGATGGTPAILGKISL
jgi:anhydro-N-acetylmuramic acid kinase